MILGQGVLAEHACRRGAKVRAADHRHADRRIDPWRRPLEHFEQLGMGHDAGAAAGQRLAGALEQLDRKAPAVQQGADAQPRDRAAGDDHPAARPAR